MHGLLLDVHVETLFWAVLLETITHSAPKYTALGRVSYATSYALVCRIDALLWRACYVVLAVQGDEEM